MSIHRSGITKGTADARSARNARCLNLFGRMRFLAVKTVLCSALISVVPFSGTITQAGASSQGVHFAAQISAPNACSIIVRRDGDFGLSADKKVLSSKIIGGLSAIADVNSGSNYNVTAIAYNFFTQGPADASLNTAFEARFSGIDVFRGRTFTERTGSSAVALRTGTSITRLNVHMIATRTGSQFPGGFYEGTVVVRCE
jgi:hypothetical protein